MPIALPTAGLPSQSHQRVGVRLVRRFGGVVLGAIVSGITLAGTLRRPAVSQTSPDHAAAQYRETSAPARTRAPRRPRAALPAPSLLPPWLARLLTRRHRQLASFSRPTCLNQGNAPFTPQAYPQLSPKACAVLNTPLKECDPKTLELVFSTFASHINQPMSPKAGMTDPAATLPNLWYRLNAALADTNNDMCLSTTPAPVPAAPADAVPDAPVVSPQPPAQALTTAPTTLSAKDATRLLSLPLSGPPASDPPTDAAITAPARQPTPHITAPSAPVGHASRSLSTPGPRRYETIPDFSGRPQERAPTLAHVRDNERGHPTGVPPPYR